MRTTTKLSPVTKIKNFKGFGYIDYIKSANSVRGHHFFSKNTMQFFNCRVLDTVYKGQLFISSEKYQDEARKYTVRLCTSKGDIATMGDFNCLSKYQAEKLAKSITIEMIKIIEIATLVFNTNKYHSQLRSYINKNITHWNKIVELELISEWFINYVTGKVLNK